MVDHQKVNEIATEDAAQVLHELSDEDFVEVVAALIKRRAFLGNIADTKKDRLALVNAITKKLKLA